MWSRKTAGAAAAMVAVSGGMAACGVATGTQAVLSDDTGECSRTRVIVHGTDFHTACWEDDDFPAQRVAEAIVASGAMDDGVISYADAQAMPDFAVFSSAGNPCLDVVAVPPNGENREGNAAQRAAEALGSWDDLPEKNRCAGGDAA
ncbi:hypothetical protein RAE03_06265 [Corynebacterium tuberculostearicum]|uniref:Lipoprotein n=1 Tax=Corynebacterium tuberculostearicum TaxID=38304 RepID=A0AAE4NMA1_9CORY|nr:hypothetical protein [Corynebacterium tuberculostearicum]MDV2419384.1 hypothetical protein [Corynebacterium tuberculostearicum]